MSVLGTGQDLPTSANPRNLMRGSDTEKKSVMWREGPFQIHDKRNPESISSSILGAHLSYGVKRFILCMLNQEH